MNVLIADDSEIIRRRLGELLSELEGVRIVGYAEDAPSTQELTRTLKPHAVVLNYQMPGGGGLDLIRKIKQQHPSILIVMFTNYPELRSHCLQAGADHFFDKAKDIGRLAALFRRLAKGQG